MTELRNKYPSVEKDGVISYGGNQQWSSRKVMRECGCGVVACVDLMLYLTMSRKINDVEIFDELSASYPLSQNTYERLCAALSPRYLPLIPHFGINGLALSVGFNCFLRRKGLAFRCRWGVKSSELFSAIERMLAEDIPVILAIGPNLPIFWRKDSANLYVKSPSGSYRKAADVRAHYVVVTGIDSQWLQLSSWGREYYISREDYRQYVKKYSNYLVSNILYIR